MNCTLALILPPLHSPLIKYCTGCISLPSKSRLKINFDRFLFLTQADSDQNLLGLKVKKQIDIEAIYLCSVSCRLCIV